MKRIAALAGTFWQSRNTASALGTGTVRLRNRRIYILPSGQGMAFLVMLVVMLLWSINYSNSMAFGLTFTVGAVMLNSLWLTHRNLLDLDISVGRATPIFVGQDAHFPLRCSVSNGRPRHGLQFTYRGATKVVHGDVSVEQGLSIAVPLQATRRGWLEPGALRVSTVFPLGLFRAWSVVQLDQRCLVYPQPDGHQALPVREAVVHGGGGVSGGVGVDDFEGLRGYVPGDSLRHIAWKAVARSDKLLVKTFHGETRKELWLDWQAVNDGDTEARLCQLCRWLLQAESEGLDYGLRLPGVTLPPANGEGHRRACLEALALFNTQVPSHVV